MKILHLCTYDVGGAGNAALRLHAGLLALGIDSVFASIRSTFQAPGKIAITSGNEDWLTKHYPRIDYHLSRILRPWIHPVFPTSVLSGCGLKAIEKEKPDIVNLHWVGHGMLGSRDFSKLANLGIPIVWTLHDMNAITGGFGFREACGLPPEPFGSIVMDGRREKLSKKNLQQRAKALANVKLTAIAPSSWLTEEARRSPVFKGKDVLHVPYGIDTEVFHPEEKTQAREKLGLPQNAKIILFGADTFEDKRKGIAHLKEALCQLAPESLKEQTLLVGFGNKTKINDQEFEIRVKGFGRISDPTILRSLYSAAGVFTCPSREDNLPNTMLESLSCGTPLVGFKVGGLIDFVIPGRSGYLAPTYSESELAKGMSCLLALSSEDEISLSEKCRNLAISELSLHKQARSYMDVYKNILNG